MKTFYQNRTLLIIFILSISFVSLIQSQRKYQKNNIHNLDRDKPVRVIPEKAITLLPPSDAIMLFDGTNLNQWEKTNFFITDRKTMIAAKGGIKSKQVFGDVQMHIEWRINDTINPNGQKGSNSGLFLMDRYEVQILESFVNTTYADGQAGALYGQFPPLVNASSPQGNWNSYDIIFKAPVYKKGKVKEKAKITVLHNGVLIQNNQEYEGPTVFKKIASYPKTHPKKASIAIQYHGDPIEFRNIWVREIDERKQKEVKNWVNPFPKDGLGTHYVYSAREGLKENKHFTIKENSIEVLYNWQGNAAPYAMLTSKKQYSSFNLELEYKWGNRKFAPRLKAKRDAGFLFHVSGDLTPWPTSLECQIQETDAGDLWVIKGPTVTATDKNGTENILNSSGAKNFQYQEKYKNYEVPGWNAVRVEVRGSKSAKFYINGHLVNEIKNFKDAKGNPLAKGWISIQAEGAELIYRNIRLQEL
ncbi:3-keto-disaccharide hydrolase [Polaribacter sp.]|uniref:3-keto-disaccharide hydrolase n=1 Tax=Polaribacter sp. TaxID=1920175 RepID=UPI003F698A62